jgi:hypothetical protein
MQKNPFFAKTNTGKTHSRNNWCWLRIHKENLKTTTNFQNKNLNNEKNHELFCIANNSGFFIKFYDGKCVGKMNQQDFRTIKMENFFMELQRKDEYIFL